MTNKQKTQLKKTDTLNSTVNKKKQSLKRKKERLFSRLNISVPIAPSLLMILPSFAAKADEYIDVDNRLAINDTAIKNEEPDRQDKHIDKIDHNFADEPKNDQATANEMHPASAENVMPAVSQAHSSHYLSERPFAVVTMFPMSNGLENSSNEASFTSGNQPHAIDTTTAIAQTKAAISYVPEVITGKYGSLMVDKLGKYTFTLNPKSPDYINLQGKEPATDTFTMHLSNGTTVVVHIPLQGQQNSPTISGDLAGTLLEDKNVDSNGLLKSLGKINVVDADHDQSAMQTETLHGKYGTLSIDKEGNWQYLVDNKQSIIQALTSKTCLSEAFTVHTSDGTAQTIQMTIGGKDDNALITGVDSASTTEELNLTASGKLDIVDSDAGEAHFSDLDIVGTLGTLHLTDSGSWTYDLDNKNPAVQALGQGSATTDIITVHSADGTAHQISITVNGTNDIPVIDQISSKIVDEGQPTITGKITSTDTDIGDSVTYSTPLSHSGFVLNPDGSYSLDPTDKSFDHLAVGEHQTLTIPVIATDNHGGNSISQNLVITINGTNDIPVIGTITAKTVDEGSPLIRGLVGALDVDHGDTITYSTSFSHSGFVLNPDGSYSLDPTDKSFDHLAVGEHQTLTIPVIATDNHGGNSVSQNLVITINGTNDIPVIGTITAKTVDEGSPLIRGLVGALDVDHDDTITYSTTLSHPGFVLNPDGSYSLDPTDKSFDHLAVGEHQTLTIPVIATDNHGGNSVSQNLVITITGTNDIPVIGTITAKTVDEGSPLIRGLVGALDVDHGDTITYSTTLSQPGFILNTDGSYSLDPTDKSFDHLAVGEHQTLTIPVIATDNHGGSSVSQNLVITINGTNNIPVIGTITAKTVDEGSPLIRGLVGALDVDHGDTITYSTPLSHSGFILNPDGSYSLDPTDKSFDHLAVGEHQTLTIPVIATDNQGGNSVSQNLVITINGTNDIPVIGTITAKTVDEGSPLIRGLVGSTDVDHGDTITYSTSFSHPGFVLNNDGSYSLDPSDKSFDHLAAGQHQTLTIPVIATDNYGGNSVSQNLVVTINGTNDGAIIAGVTTGIATEDSLLKTTGQLTITDLDSGENHFSNTDVIGALGTLHLTDTGSWTYDLDNKNPAVQALAKGDTTTDILTVHSADGTPHQITISVKGTNDAAVIGGVDTGSVDEGTAGVNMSPDYAQPGMSNLGQSALSVDGKLTISDPDKGEEGFDPKGGTFTSYSGQYGHLLLNTDGNWHYMVTVGTSDYVGNVASKVGSVIDQLGEGQSLTDTVTVYSKDGTAHDIVITIHGDNDRPYCGAEVTLAPGREDTSMTITATQLLVNTHDVDANDTGKLTIDNLHVDHGSLQHNIDGTYTLTQEKDYNGDVHFNYDVKDAHGGVTHTGASTTLSAVNDNPDTQPVIDSITEDTDTHHAVNLLSGAGDVDGDSLLISQVQISFEGKTGSLTKGVSFASDGHTLVIDSHSPTFQHLSAGEKSDIVVHYMVDDNHGGQTAAIATITMVGSDDKATLASNVIQMTETQALDSPQHSYKGSLQLIDPDTGDNTQFIFSGQYIGQGAAPGSLNIWPDGSYQFRLQGALNRHTDDLVGSLHAGESMEFPYEIKTSDSQTLTIMVKVTGEDSNAQINVAMPSMMPATRQLTEDSFINASATHLYVGGRLQVVDPDHDQAYLQAESINTAHHGQFNIRADGGWSYTIDNTIDEVQHLGAGESFTETHTAHSLDGTASQLLTVTVHGTNDAPVVSAAVRLVNGTEDTDIKITQAQLLAHATDIDDNDFNHLHVDAITSDHGSLTKNTDGSFIFHPDKNYNGQVNFNYDVKDAHGGVTHTGATTTLAAVQDQAIVSGDLVGNVIEDHDIYVGNQIEVTGHLLVSDPDAGQQGFQYTRTTSINDPFAGTLHISATGTWTYDVDNAKLQHLAANQEIFVSHRVYTTDGTTQDIVIKVTGTNDGPTLDDISARSLKEDSNIITGHVNSHDVDDNATAIYSAATVAGFNLNKDGSYSFDPKDAAYQHLNSGQSQNITIPITVTDEQHASATKNLIITITGTNDDAVISGVDTGSVSENNAGSNMSPDNAQPGMATLGNSVLSVSGQLSIIDPDSGESTFGHHVGAYNYHGSYGDLILNADGTWHYHADAGSVSHIGGHPTTRGSAIDQLGEGQSLTDTITVHSKDGTQHDIVISIHGSNDRPYCSSEVTLQGGSEDTKQTFTLAQLLANTVDVDANDAGKLSVANLRVDHGSILDNGNGTYTLTQEKDYNGDIRFSYDVKDAHGGVTHTGATTTLVAVQDQAIVGGDLVGNVIEDHDIYANNQIEITGHLLVTDPDAGQQGFQYTRSTSVNDPFSGSLHISASGTWTYDVDNAKLQHLGANQEVLVTHRVYTSDGTAQDIIIKVTGSNDAPVVSSEVVLQTSTEDTDIILTQGQLLANSTDIDNNDVNQLHIDSVTANHGTVSKNTDGSFTFHPDQDYNGQVHFSYDVKDSHGGVAHTGATTTLSAVDDATALTSAATNDLIEDTPTPVGRPQNELSTGWNDIQLTDPDGGSPSIQQVIVNGHTQNWNSGHLLSFAGRWGTVEIGDLWPHGMGKGQPVKQWLYRTDNTDAHIQGLGAGETHQESITLVTNDGTHIPITVTITGVNDTVVLDSSSLGQITEGRGPNIASGQLHAHDADQHDTVHFQATTGSGLVGAYGHLTINAQGQWNYTLDQAKAESLAAGDFKAEWFSVKAISSDGSEVTRNLQFNVVGSNQAAHITDVQTDITQIAVTESSHVDTTHHLNYRGQLHITDVDNLDDSFEHGSGSTWRTSDYTSSLGGRLSIDKFTGQYHYSIDNNNAKIQALGAGQHLTDSIDIQSKDGTHYTINITINGSNTNPVASSAVILANGTEDTDIHITQADLISHATDVDHNDIGQLNVANLVADHGAIVDNKDGTFTFHPEKDYNGQVHFSYDVTDAHGGATHASATTTLAAVNDMGIFSLTDTGSVEEDVHVQGDAHHTVAVSGVLNVSDADAGESEFVANRNVHAVNDPFAGDLSIGRAGDWTYSVPNSNLNRLAEGEKHQVTYEVVSRGGDKHQIVITVVGTNDQPTIITQTLAHGTEDINYQMQASQFGFSDVDSGDTLHSISLTTLPNATEGKFVVDGHDVTANQVITASDISKLQFVPANNFNGDVDFGYTVNDGHTDSQEATNTLHINPVNDAATIDGQSQSNVSATITEDSATSVISGHLTLLDPDAGEDKFAANTQISGQYGQLTLDENGSWHYALNNTDPAVDALDAGQQLTDTLTITSPDGSASETIAITIQGHSDTPSLQLQEAGAVQGLNLFAGIQGNGIRQLQYSTDGVNFSSQIPPGFSLAADGHTLEVDPANVAYDHLANGVQHKIWVNYQLQEGSGSSTHQSSQQAQIVIAGTSDDPVIHSFKANTDQFSGPVTGNLLQGATDIDDGSQLVLRDIQFKDPNSHHYVTVHAGQDVNINNVGHISVASNGDYSFTPDPHFHGDAPSFIYRIVDTHGDNQDDSQSTLSIHINANHQPTVQTLTASTAEDTDFHFNVTSFGYQDKDSDTLDHLSINQLPDPVAGILMLNSHAVTKGQAISVNEIDQLIFKPTANFNGDAHFSYVANDGHQDSISHTAVLTVTAVNDLPTLTINQTSHIQGDLVATDVDTGDTLSFSAAQVTGNFGSLSIDPDSGAYTYTQNNSVAHMSYNPANSTYTGIDTFEVQVSDHHGGVVSKYITFNAQATVSSTGAGTLVINSSIPSQPVVSGSLPAAHVATTLPVNRVSIDLSATSDSGSSNNDDLTNDNTPTINGHTDIPFSKVTIYDGNTPVGHALSDANGDFNSDLSTLTDGIHNLSAKALAPSAIVPVPSSLLTINVDTTISPLAIALTNDTGSSNDLISSDGSLTIAGQQTGASVEYSIDNGVHWSQSFTPTAGQNTVTVRQTDPAGNVSGNSSLSFTLDNSVSAPGVTLRHDTTGQFTNTPDLISKDARLSIQSEAGAKVEYSNDGGHSWNTVFNPAEGVNNLLVRQTDIAGNLSAATHFSFTLDSQPGTVSVNPISQDNALNAAENNLPLVITGTTSNIAPGDRVYVKLDNNHFYDATVKADGSWTLTLGTSIHQSILSTDGRYPIKVGAVDLAGNTTPEVSTHLLVDTQNPLPQITVNSVTADNIINHAESGQKIDITGQVSGDFNAGDVVSLSVNGAMIRSLTGTVDAQGHYSISVPAQTLIKANIHSIYASGQQQIHSLEATIETTDQAGNIGSATTGAQAFTIDTQASAAIQLDSITSDNVINAQESGTDISVTGHVSGDAHQGDVVSLSVGQHSYTATVDHNGHFSVNIAGAELASGSSITASVATTDKAGNSANATQVIHYDTDTHVDMPTITFENPGTDNAYSKAEIAQGHADTITATVRAAADAQIGEHLNINGVNHVLDANSLAQGIALEVAPGSIVKAIMTDEHGNINSALSMAANAKPEPIVVTAPPGSHHIGASLGIPTLAPTQAPVPLAEQGWKILVNGHYETSYSSQWGTLSINPQTGQISYQEHANTHTGPHGSASTVGVHEDRFEVALQGSHHDDVIMHVQVNILSHGPGHSGKLTLGTEVVDMTVTPVISHQLPVSTANDEPDFIDEVSVDIVLPVDDQSEDTIISVHTDPHPITGAAAYLDALGVSPATANAAASEHKLPADLDIVMAEAEQITLDHGDSSHLDLSDALEHQDHQHDSNQDDHDDIHNHHQVDAMPEIDPNS